MNGEHWCPLYFDDCRIPAEQVLLGAGGFKRQISGFNVERLGNSARSIAVGRYAFDRAKEYLLTRHQFGRPLAEFQGLQWMFADAAVKLESAQLLLERAGTTGDRLGLPTGPETAMAKLAANQAGFFAADVADAGDGRDRLLRRQPRRVLLPAHPRLDDRRRLGRDPEEPHRRARLRPAVPVPGPLR